MTERIGVRPERGISSSSASDGLAEARPASRIAWYALKTRSRHEQLVARSLRERGVDCFLPLLRERHRWSDRSRVVDVPLFSTYVFVRIDPRDRFEALRTRGAVSLLGTNGEPTPVPDAEIDAIARLVAAGAPLERHRLLVEGQRVRIRSGPFRGIEGTLIHRQGRSKLLLSVDLLRQGAALTIDGLDVEPA